ncbi:cation-translocating P-type ATPase [Candidatus Nitrospira nitrificans]|uniref:Calcium-transporting ATPase n=1 Tax=Candidatus Nitrospira nitrificans TaxID=1742973 RepID=A0A0S4LC16_9BACT|nr:cation-translocating P-type ATPase [Candidatus Nitrospira nitrificans]CUS35223.1 Calcium-transporting ATPase [Candidatus Nitrospira nitrificans]
MRIEKRLPEASGTTSAPAWYGKPTDALVGELRTDLGVGLTVEESARRLAQEGPNELPDAPPPSLLKLFLAQFSSLIVWVLIGAAVVSGLLEDWIDAAAILAIVFLNGLLGFVQEFRAERSLAALRKMSVATACVIRGGGLQSIPARELVTGDVVALEAGDRIPADARLFYATNFQAQEASLTGESTPVQKQAERIEVIEVPLADQHNMVFMGTAAVSGKARGLVVATGLNTELGRIAAMIQKAAEAERDETPLQRRLEQFGYTLLWLALGVVTVVFALGYFRGEPLMEMFLTSVSLAVAAVPEGLPAVVTITLAMGVTRMAKRHALIRKLPAVETLGSATVICTDKTGTLTKNEMTVTRLVMDGSQFEVTGEGYEPVGEIQGMINGQWFMVNGQSSNAGEGNESLFPPSSITHRPSLPEGLRRLLTAAVLCNGATLRQENGTWLIIGDPTEGALLVAAAKAGLTKAELEPRAPLEGEVPFDAERKMMTIVRRTEQGHVAYCKGAPDVLLNRCAARVTLDGRTEALDEAHRQLIGDANASLAQQALRVLGVAYRPLGQSASSDGEVERELIFLGLLAMKDPLRHEAAEAVRLCRDAGIRTSMITGDHKETAIAIARELGLYRDDGVALSGSELDGLTDEQLTQRVERVTVYARVSAEHKLRIVQAWKRKGAIVAMTGDGVNDAPAIKAADIGVAMGMAGTDVTKEASDMVVTDDNFASIAAAVEEGRGIFDNIRKTVHFLLSCNVSEVLVMLFATLFGLPLPLLPIHILWMNLVTDGFPALALAVDPKAPDLMRQPPRQTQARLLDGGKLWTIAGEGLMLAVIALSTFSYSLFVWQQPIEQARTVTFTVMVAAQLVHAFNCRSDRRSLFQVGATTNHALILAVAASLALQVGILTIPVLEPIFKVAPLPVEDWKLMMAMALLPLAVVEAVKWFQRRISAGLQKT